MCRKETNHRHGFIIPYKIDLVGLRARSFICNHRRWTDWRTTSVWTRSIRMWIISTHCNTTLKKQMSWVKCKELILRAKDWTWKWVVRRLLRRTNGKGSRERWSLRRSDAIHNREQRLRNGHCGRWWLNPRRSRRWWWWHSHPHTMNRKELWWSIT